MPVNVIQNICLKSKKLDFKHVKIQAKNRKINIADPGFQNTGLIVLCNSKI